MGLQVKSKIWLENEKGELVIGTGRLRILEAILEVGSINKAAKKLGQPFRTVWGKIKTAEERGGFHIVESTSSGTRLTREGLELLLTYKEFRKRCKSYADHQFRELFSKSQAGRRSFRERRG